MSNLDRRTLLIAVLAVAIAAVVLVGLSTCGAPEQVQNEDVQEEQRNEDTPQAAVDWEAVGQAIGKEGELMEGDVYRVDLPRSDLQVISQGVQIRPAFALGSYAAFKGMDNGRAMVMGDLVLTEEEYNRVISRLQEGSIGQTAVHKHLLDESPAIWWVHFQGSGNPVALAGKLRSALELTGTPLVDTGDPELEEIGLDTGRLDEILGHEGRAEGGVYKYSIGRAEPVTQDGTELPPAMSAATVLNFQPTGDGFAVINGDFVMTEEEVDLVIRALRGNDIQVVALHNHGLSEEPRLFYVHFWANDDAARLAEGLRAALDETNSA